MYVLVPLQRSFQKQKAHKVSRLLHEKLMAVSHVSHTIKTTGKNGDMLSFVTHLDPPGLTRSTWTQEPLAHPAGHPGPTWLHLFTPVHTPVHTCTGHYDTKTPEHLITWVRDILANLHLPGHAPAKTHTCLDTDTHLPGHGHASVWTRTRTCLDTDTHLPRHGHHCLRVCGIF